MQTFQAVGGNASNATNASAPANSTSNANATILPGPETDAMRLLLNLLRTQISQYMAQLSRADVANNETVCDLLMVRTWAARALWCITGLSL